MCPWPYRGGAGGDVDEVTANGGAAGLAIGQADQGPGGAQQVVRDRDAGQPGRVGGEDPGRQVGQGAVSPVGEDLLHDRAVAVLFFGLDQLEGRVGKHGVVAPGGEQLVLPGSGLLVQVADRRTISRAVIAWPFFEVNVVYSVSVTWASETQQLSWSSQIARG
jgi:hypothetical protein